MVPLGLNTEYLQRLPQNTDCAVKETMAITMKRNACIVTLAVRRLLCQWACSAIPESSTRVCAWGGEGGEGSRPLPLPKGPVPTVDAAKRRKPPCAGAQAQHSQPMLRNNLRAGKVAYAVAPKRRSELHWSKISTTTYSHKPQLSNQYEIKQSTLQADGASM